MFGTRLGLAEESTAVNDNCFFFPCTPDITSLLCDLNISKPGSTKRSCLYDLWGRLLSLLEHKSSGSLSGARSSYSARPPPCNVHAYLAHYSREISHTYWGDDLLKFYDAVTCVNTNLLTQEARLWCCHGCYTTQSGVRHHRTSPTKRN